MKKDHKSNKSYCGNSLHCAKIAALNPNRLNQLRNQGGTGLREEYLSKKCI